MSGKRGTNAAKVEQAINALAAEPWARQPNETSVAFEAFRTYRDLEPSKRSLVKVAERVGKSDSLMARWSRKHGWVRRAQAWDERKDAEKRAQELAEVKKMGERHAQQAQTFGRVLLEPAMVLVEKLKQDSDAFRAELRKMKSSELLALVRACAGAYPSLMRAERLARGESTDNVEGRIAVDAVKALASRVAARAAKYIPDGELPKFLADLKRDFENELG